VIKAVWLCAAVGAAVLAAPGMAQEDPVKAGVEAYERGDYAAAVERWRRAAASGNADAQFNLGQAYKLGRGVQPDMRQAEDWYRRAALQGHEQAEANYGLALFENGKRADSVQWLQRAVARGDARAQYVFGIMLFNGDAVEKDWVRGYALMVRASQSGLDAASKALAQMDQYIPLGDRQQGLALARKYEQEYARGPLPLPPIQTASAAPVRRPAANRPSGRPSPAPAQVPAPRVATASGGDWRVQLGAFADAGNARKLWSQVGARFAGRQPYYVKSGSLTKLLVGPFGSRGEAAAACGSVRPCVPTR
jgi:TPR repeat protein